MLNPAGVTIYLDYCLLDGNRSMNSPFSLDSALGAALAVPYAGLSIAYTAQVASKSYSISSHLTLLYHNITLKPLVAFTIHESYSLTLQICTFLTDIGSPSPVFLSAGLLSFDYVTSTGLPSS